MRRIFPLCMIIIMSVFLTSCIDILQVININKAGELDITYRFSIIKTEEAAGAGPGAPSGEDLPIHDMEESFANLPQVKVAMDTSETEYDSVYTLNIFCPLDHSQAENSPLLPLFSNGAMSFYPMLFPDSKEESETKEMANDEFAMTMLMGIKYKLLLSKKVFSSVKEVVLINSSNEEKMHTFTDLGDYYLVDVPLGLFVKDTKTKLEFRNKSAGPPAPMRVKPQAEKPRSVRPRIEHPPEEKTERSGRHSW